MTRNVNVYPTNWRWTGQDVLAPQAEVDLEINWIDDDGVPCEWSGVLTFPNDLQLIPVALVREMLKDLIVGAARARLGVDEVGQ